MGLFRRRNETYNQQMLREAGLDRVVFNEPDVAPAEQAPRFAGAYDITSKDIVRDWDAATTARVPGLPGDRVAFTTLPNGDLIVDEETGNADLSPLADAVEQRVQPPYRCVAERKDGDLWAAGAKRIEVAQLEFPDGDTLELSQSDGESELRVDGEPSHASVPVELQRLGERAGADFCVEANRIDGDSWEVRVSAL